MIDSPVGKGCMHFRVLNPPFYITVGICSATRKYKPSCEVCVTHAVVVSAGCLLFLRRSLGFSSLSYIVDTEGRFTCSDFFVKVSALVFNLCLCPQCFSTSGTVFLRILVSISILTRLLFRLVIITALLACVIGLPQDYDQIALWMSLTVSCIRII